MSQIKHPDRKIRLGIVGATGYVGMELVRFLHSHPNFEITALCSKSFAGKPFSEIYPAFKGLVDLDLIDIDPNRLAQICDVVVTALPHGVSASIVSDLLDRGLRVLDHSADFRFNELGTYETAYKVEHPHPELLSEAVYGLPELYRSELAQARLVANPGCYPTCAILALSPLISDHLIESQGIIVDAASGITGAGRRSDAAYTVAEMGQNYKPYGVIGHRHTPEMREKLSMLTDEAVRITFTPHLLPIGHGMLATIYARPNFTRQASGQAFDTAKLVSLYKEYYKDEAFVRVLDEGSLPQTSAVCGSNFCDLAPVYDADSQLIKIFSAIDNLGKGACAQAVQALNIMFGLAETSGLTGAPLAI